jgi:hypothetical protein
MTEPTTSSYEDVEGPTEAFVGIDGWIQHYDSDGIRYTGPSSSRCWLLTSGSDSRHE